MQNWEQIYFVIAFTFTVWWLFLYLRGVRRYRDVLTTVNDTPFMPGYVLHGSSSNLLVIVSLPSHKV